jgi:hypothetical protein
MVQTEHPSIESHMFRTHPPSPGRGLVGGEDAHCERVELLAQTPLLLVSIPVVEAGETQATLTRSFLLEAGGLEDHLIAYGEASSVDLLSPPWLNGGAGWKLEPLLELHLCAELDEQVDRAWLFVVPNGRYPLSPVRSPAEKLIRVKRVFKARAGRQSIASEVLDD